MHAWLTPRVASSCPCPRPPPRFSPARALLTAASGPRTQRTENWTLGRRKAQMERGAVKQSHVHKLRAWMRETKEATTRPRQRPRPRPCPRPRYLSRSHNRFNCQRLLALETLETTMMATIHLFQRDLRLPGCRLRLRHTQMTHKLRPWMRERKKATTRVLGMRAQERTAGAGKEVDLLRFRTKAPQRCHRFYITRPVKICKRLQTGISDMRWWQRWVKTFWRRLCRHFVMMRA